MNKNLSYKSGIIKSVILLLGFHICGCSIHEPIGGEAMMDKTQYYVSPLPKEEWYDEKVLDYSQGNFTFPPPAGYRIMRYSKKRDNLAQSKVVLDIFREQIDIDSTFAKLIKRRQGSDHCDFTDEEYGKKLDVDMVMVNASCYRWQSGEFKRRYYFIKSKNLVYTFRMTSAKDEYEEMVPDFDHFVNYTISQYMKSAEEAETREITDRQLNPDIYSIFHPQKK